MKNTSKQPRENKHTNTNNGKYKVEKNRMDDEGGNQGMSSTPNKEKSERKPSQKGKSNPNRAPSRKTNKRSTPPL